MGSLPFLRFFRAFGLLASAACATAAHAQTPPDAPQLEMRISLWSMSGSGRTDLLRRAHPDGDIATWLDAGDPVVTFAGGGRAWSGVLVVRLSLSPDGRMTGCEMPELPELPHGLRPEAVAGLCERLAPHVRYRPALTAEGQRVEDSARLLIRSARYRAADAAAMPLIRAAPLPPAPPVPRPGPGWPPLVSLTPARLVGGLALLEGGGDAPEATASPWTGVEVQLGETGAVLTCRTINSSGDAAFDDQACAAARRADYALNGATVASDRRVYLLLVRQAGRLRALPQARSGRASPVLESRSAIAMAAEWAARPWPRVFVTIDTDGSPTDCRINETAGDDAVDLAACEMIRRAARFTPARDSLDRPTPGSVFLAELPAGH